MPRTSRKVATWTDADVRTATQHFAGGPALTPRAEGEDTGAWLRRNTGYLTEDEAAAFTNKEIRTLANLRHKRTGPRFVKAGRTVLYPVGAILEWLHNHEVHTTGYAIKMDEDE